MVFIICSISCTNRASEDDEFLRIGDKYVMKTSEDDQIILFSYHVNDYSDNQYGSQYLVDNYGNVYYFHGDKPTKEYDMSDITQNVVGQIDPKEVEEAYRLLMDVNCYDSLDNEYPHSDIYIEPDNNGYRENGQNYWARLYKHKKDTYKAGEGFPLYSYDGNAMNLTSEKGKEVSAIVVSWFADEKYHEFDEYGKYRDAVDEE